MKAVATEERRLRWFGALAHATFLFTMMGVSGWTWAKLLVAAVWLAMAFFEQRRGRAVGAHWSAPAIGGVWLVLSVLVMCSTSAPSHVAALAGTGLMTLGAFLRVQAISTLGAGYSDGVRPIRSRVRHGVYAHLHHPGELGALLLAIGAAAAVGSNLGLAWAVASLLPLTLYRFRLEEDFLRQAEAG